MFEMSMKKLEFVQHLRTPISLVSQHYTPYITNKEMQISYSSSLFLGYEDI
jgi:hypothetical protein